MTSAAFTSLSAPLFDDNMDLASSPAGNAYDYDPDAMIDFDDDGTYDVGAHITDDDRMLDDGDPTATDHEMHDDDVPVDALPHEEVMQDGPTSYHSVQPEMPDEELIDYGEDDFQDHGDAAFDSTFQTVEPSLEAAASIPAQSGAVQEHTTGHNEDSTVEKLAEQTAEGLHRVQGDTLAITEPRTEEQPAENLSSEHVIPSEDASAPDQAQVPASQEKEEQDEKQTKATDSADAAAEASGEPEIVDFEDELADDETDDLKPQPRLPGTINTTVDHVLEGPPTPTDTGLLPMIIRFEDYEMPLFKSRRQPDGLLKDDNLASVSLADLMQNSRQRLVIKTGEVCITEAEDLVLSFDCLPLVLIESSRSASEYSLNDVLDVYKQLHMNDGIEDTPPLYMTFQKQPKFNSCLDQLKRMVASGQGIPKINVDAHNSASDGAELNPAGDGAQNADEADGTYVQDFAAEEGDYEQSGYYEDAQEYEEEDQDDQYPADHGEHPENDEYPDPEPEDDFTSFQEPTQNGDNAESPHKFGAQDSTEDLISANEEVTAGPTASSATFYDDAAHGTTGEYDPEDLIDWDDDSSLTAYSSESHEDNGNDDFSTLITDPESIPAKVQEPSEEHVDQKTQEPAPPGETYEDQLALDPDSRDLLNGGSAEKLHADFDNLEGFSDSYYDDAGNELAEFDENDYDQADQVEHNEQGEYQPGEDSEQFHTAIELHDDDEGSNGDDDNSPAVQTENQPQGHDQDEIDFDDDTEYGDEHADATVAASDSPLGKRSFEQLAEEDELNFDEPELKKARSS